MATFHCRASVGHASKGAGHAHSQYQQGLGAYADKTEVVMSQSFNLPTFANNDATKFFQASDENERKNGTSYRALIVSIPHEAKDPVKWSEDFVKKIIPDQASLMSVHLKEGNWHLHLMFSERNATNKDLPEEKYFSRANPKVQGLDRRQWLKSTKEKMLEHIRTVAPGYTPELKGGKEKQLRQWEVESRIDDVREIRRLNAELAKEDNYLKDVNEKVDALINKYKKEIEDGNTTRNIETRNSMAGARLPKNPAPFRHRMFKLRECKLDAATLERNGVSLRSNELCVVRSERCGQSGSDTVHQTRDPTARQSIIPPKHLVKPSSPLKTPPITIQSTVRKGGMSM